MRTVLIPKKVIALIIVVILLIFVSFLGYNWSKNYQISQEVLNKNENLSPEAVNELIKRVGKLIDLPQDEVPSIVTVLDKDKLTGETFFDPSQKGDRVLIYVKAQKAFLYRPSQNRIINTGPVNIAQNQASASAQTATPAAAQKP